nr:hypothetical protein [Tanacetum cinerariifolium]
MLPLLASAKKLHVPTLLLNPEFPPVNRKFSTGSRNFPTVNRKFSTASRRFPTGSTKNLTAVMGMKGKVVKPSGSFQNKINDKGYWDSGCSRHMTCNISYLSDYEPFDGGYVSFGQGGCKITGKGTIKIGKLEFENVYFMKDLKYNLFSVSQIYDNKNSVLFTDSECIVLGRDFKLLNDDNILLRTPRQHNMYSIDLNNIVPHRDLTCLVAKSFDDECMIWHRRLGHLNFKTMNKLVRHNLVRGLPTKCFENNHNCTAFLKGKRHKASCKSKLVNSVSKPLHTLHMDLFGPTSVSSISHKWYCLVITDDFSWFTWTFFLKTKDESSGILRKFITEIENLKNLKVKIIRSLIEAARTMLADAKLPVTFWAEVVNTDCYVQNKVLVNKAHNKTPYELFNGKFEAKGDEDYFLGYSMSSKAFRVFNKRTKRVEENLHIEFLENKAIEKGSGLNWLFDIDSLTKSINYVPVVDAGINSTNFLGTKVDARQDVKKDMSSLRYIVLPNWVHEEHLESPSSQPQDACNTDAPESSGNSNPTATSTNPPADQLETLTVETLIPTVSSPVPTVCFTDSQEPSSETRLISKRVTNQAETPSLDNILTFSNQFEDILRVTTNSEESSRVEADVSNMETTITASPTPTLRIHMDHPKNQKIGHVDTPIQTRNKSKESPRRFLMLFKTQVRTKWVLKNKKDERGIVIRNKARLVAQGHTQEEGVNYDEVFAPVARIEAIRLFLAYASFMGFTVYQMDVKSAIGFLKPFGCHVMILNTLDNLGTKVDARQDVKKDVSSLRYIVPPNWVHEEHLESPSSQPQDTCNTDAPESSGNSNPTATLINPLADQLETLTVETLIPTVSSPVPTVCFTDSQEPSSETRLISKRVTNQEETPSLNNILTLSNQFEDILGVTTNSEESNGVEADVSNMETTITASPTPTLRIHRDHPKSQIIGLVDTPIQTRNKAQEDFDALQDPSWVEAMQEKLFQFKIQKVWSLVNCPKGEEGIDYDEVFAHVAIIEAIRLFLAYASFMGFTVYQMDVKSAFLYGTIDEEVYVMQPPRFQDPEYPARVYKVEKAMYGLHQAPRAWRMAFFLSQDKYVGDILNKFRYSDVRSSNTSMDKENPWGKDGTGKDVDLHLYRSMIGSLMYLTASRPDIMFAICACAMHQVTPKECHLHAVKKIFRYLKGHPKLGLWYPKDSPFDLVAYSNSDYGGATQDPASCCGQVLWIQNQLLDYGDCFEKKLINEDHIHTDENVADLLTKPFDAGRFQYLICKLFPLLGKLSTASVFLGFGLTFTGTPSTYGILRILMISPRLIPLSEHNIDFHPMVDFVEASPLRYALTFKPTIYVSHIQQLWSTARIETTEEGTQILAIVDGVLRTVTESSLRRNLKLQDEEGVSSFPDTELFENLTLMGYNISPNKKNHFSKSSNIATALVCLATNRTYNFSKMIFDGLVKNVNNKVLKFLMYPSPSFSGRIVPLFDTMLIQQGEGSETPIEPHHTPSQEAQPSSHTHISSPSIPTVRSVPAIPIPTVIPSETTPIRQYTLRARIAQSSAFPPITDKPASPMRDVSQGEACPIDSGFIADQDMATITKSSTLLHDSVPRVTSPAAEEGSIQQSINELTALYTSLQRQHSRLLAKFQAQEVEINRLKERVKILEDKGGVIRDRSRDDAPIKGRRIDEEEVSTKRVSSDTKEVRLDEGTTEVPTGSGSIPTAGPSADEVPTGSDVVPTASPVFTTAIVVTPYRRRKGKEIMVESETLKKQKLQEQIDAQIARELKEQLERED